VSALTLETELQKPQRDFTLIFWLAANSPPQVGAVRLTEPRWAWLPDGGLELPAGEYAIEDLQGKAADSLELNLPAAIDPWSDSVGLWLAPPTEEEPFRVSVGRPPSAEDALARDLALVLESLAVLQEVLPECSSWVEFTTKVVMLLPGLSNTTRNWSRQDLPGAIYTTTPHSTIEVLETIVHEAAHRHFFLAETHGAVLSCADVREFSSPLRKDLRPLRGIMLAYHALCYMGALYSELDRRGLLVREHDLRRFDRLRTQANACAATINGASKMLSPFGVSFVDATSRIARHAFG
jgi:HEXXH motif-containing protein